MKAHQYILRSWDWVHPSHRDLIIDQLSYNREMALRYLEKGGISAINLALSKQGGAAGEREFPLLRYPESWNVLRDACIQQIEGKETSKAARILVILESAASPPITTELAILIASVCRAAKGYWDANETILSAAIVRRYIKLCEISGEYIACPSLKPSWEYASTAMKQAAKEAVDNSSSFEGNELAAWIAMVNVVKSTEPRLIPKGSLKEQFEGSIDLYIEALEEALNIEIDEEEEAETFENEAKRLKDLGSVIANLEKLIPDRQDTIAELSEKLSDRSHDLQIEAEQRSQEPDDDREYGFRGSNSAAREISIEKIFDDL
jgi:hypothetical protein